MRIIDADALMDDIKRDSKKAIDEGDKVGSFWLGHATGLAIKQPTIQPEKAQLSKEGTTSDLISRQWLLDCINEGWIKFDTDKDANRFIHLVRDIAPSAQPEPTDIDAREAVYNLAEKIGIHQLFALTVELRGEPIQPEPQEGHWIEGKIYRDVIECNCSECGQLMTTAATVRMSFCPNCGAKMTTSTK